MSKLENKIDFVAFVSVTNANPNGDPLCGVRPRTDTYGYGEMSTVCIKRKIRNRMQDLGNCIFVQSDDRINDNFSDLGKRADCLSKIKNEDEFTKTACETWMDVRTFGQVFAFKGFGLSSVGVKGPVSIHQTVSVDPVETCDMQITKSTSNEKSAKGTRSSDTMGTKSFVRFGLYKIKGAINTQFAEKTGFSAEDADTLKECLRTLFVNDASEARPDGSMEIVKIFWWKHNCKDGQYSSAKVHRSVKAHLREGITNPTSADDYEITVEKLDGLEAEIIDGI